MKQLKAIRKKNNKAKTLVLNYDSVSFIFYLLNSYQTIKQNLRQIIYRD